MTAQAYPIRKHYFPAHPAVMADVAVRHEEAVLAHLGRSAAILRADVHRHAFADVAPRTDDEPCRPPSIAHRLRWRPKGRERIDDGPIADGCVAGDVDVGEQPASGTDNDMLSDHAVRSDLHIVGDLRAGLDARGRMNTRHSGSGLGDHRAEFGFTRGLPADLGLAAVPPHVSALGELAHVVL